MSDKISTDPSLPERGKKPKTQAPDSPLRKRAGNKLDQTGKKRGSPLRDDQPVLHELQVPQIELELQNEELRNAKALLEEAQWMEKHDEALSRGFAGMRVSGNPYWIDNKKDWDDFACYEAEINNVIGGTKLLVLCTYSLKKCGVMEIVDVVKNHEFALAMNHGKWQIVSNPSCAHGHS